MPASAYALVATFAVMSLLSGVAAARLIGPPRWWAAIVPALGAFAALYLVGHRWMVSIGPEVELFGWDVALPFDIAVAVVTASGAAWMQLAVVRLFQAQQRSAGGDGLA